MNINPDSEIIEELEDEETESAINSFRTYKNYLWAISLYLENNYGIPPYQFLEDECKSAPAYERVLEKTRGRPRLPDDVIANVRKLLFNAWHTEFLFALPKEKYPHLIRYSNHWSPVQAYYAVFLAIQAYIEASRRERPRKHARTLQFISEDIVGKKMLPQPWATVCQGCVQLGEEHYPGMPSSHSIDVVSCLSNPMDGRFWDWFAMFLRTTRRRQFLDKVPGCKRRYKTKASKPRKNLLAKHKRELDNSIHATTLFDGLYRLRLRSNYKDADAFMLGTLGDRDAKTYFNSLLDITHSSMYVIELYIEAYLGSQHLADIIERFRTVCPELEEEHPLSERWP